MIENMRRLLGLGNYLFEFLLQLTAVNILDFVAEI